MDGAKDRREDERRESLIVFTAKELIVEQRELIRDLGERMDAGFHALEEKLEPLGSRVAALEPRVKDLETGHDDHENRIKEIETKFVRRGAISSFSKGMWAVIAAAVAVVGTIISLVSDLIR